MTTLATLGERLFENVEKVEKLWIDIFGKNLEEIWEDSSQAIKKIVVYTKEQLNRKGLRNGEASLFIRDPLSDRLNLVFSSNQELNPESGVPPNKHYFSDRDEHYDTQQQYCFYSLCDRLSSDDEKISDRARRKRGLTGWVAVTGHTLRVNSERSKSRLEDIVKDDPETQPQCNKYGTPLWGNHIAEFPRDDSPSWSKRFLAVPIKSLYSPSTTIGVLRYTCLPEGGVLTEIDTIFLKSMAEIISVIKNLEQVKTHSLRKYQLPLQEKFFEESGNFYDYLSFICQSLNSNISSLYICLNINGKRVLRLFDAYGVTRYTGELRLKNKLKDYNDDSKGLTHQLLKNNTDDPEMFNTVIKSDEWRGLNTGIFYGRSLKKLGIRNIEEQLEEPFQKRKLLDTYSIKLIGSRLSYNGKVVGVFKVEFPSSFDSSRHYEKEDIPFFNDCKKILCHTLYKYINVLDGSFLKDNALLPIDIAKITFQIEKVKLVTKEECPHYYENIKKYVKQNPDEIKEANDFIYEKILVGKNKNLFIRIWQKAPDYIRGGLFSAALRALMG